MGALAMEGNEQEVLAEEEVKNANQRKAGRQDLVSLVRRSGFTSLGRSLVLLVVSALERERGEND